MNRSPFKICLDARLIDGQNGGIQQTVIGLASGLSKLTDGDERYYFLVYPQSSNWLNQYISGTCRMLQVPLSHRQQLNMFLERLPYSRLWLEVFRRLFRRALERLPVSEGIIESAGMDLMHFTFQSAFVTRILSIYQIHDLQHEQCPQFFTKGEIALRDFRYRKFCHQASLVPVFLNWIKDDLIRLYGLPEQKVPVIPWAPVVDAYPTVDYACLKQIREKYALPKDFILFPAQTFPHKNHIGLIEALWLLRRVKNLHIPLVCTGTKTNFFKPIQRHIQRLEMKSQTHFLGFVSPVDLQGLYRLCRLMVFPSFYEGWGLPVTEALKLGVPIASSNLPSLKEQAQDGAIYFNPEKSDEIAYALERLWLNARLRTSLVNLGKAAVNRYSWVKTAKIFRAHYRRIAKRPMTDEDKFLIQQSA
jgi:glycosyltransferase involved in cell wall biosynthesis